MIDLRTIIRVCLGFGLMLASAATAGAGDVVDDAAQERLDAAVTLHFAEEAPLSAVLDAIRAAAGDALKVELAASVRKQADADRLQREFGDRYVPLLMDITDADAIQRASQKVGAVIGSNRLTGLVNNAGIVVSGPLFASATERVQTPTRGEHDRPSDGDASLRSPAWNRQQESGSNGSDRKHQFLGGEGCDSSTRCLHSIEMGFVRHVGCS